MVVLDGGETADETLPTGSHHLVWEGVAYCDEKRERRERENDRSEERVSSQRIILMIKTFLMSYEMDFLDTFVFFCLFKVLNVFGEQLDVGRWP